ncbi:MAG TPA: hypothetical protein VK982_03345 [Bacteroidales bacterium]|nr:hypothetical protein [Bacteroidales bacterium]
MKIFTVSDISDSREYESILHVSYIGSPYQAFSDIPFLTNSQSGKISEESIVIIAFEDYIACKKAFDLIKNQKEYLGELDVALIHRGELVDTVSNYK